MFIFSRDRGGHPHTLLTLIFDLVCQSLYFSAGWKVRLREKPTKHQSRELNTIIIVCHRIEMKRKPQRIFRDATTFPGSPP